VKIAIITCVLACTSLAHAEDKAAAEQYFRAGAKAYAAQNFAAAAADFDEAYKALPRPEIAFSAAQAYRRLYRIDPKPHYVQRSVELYRIYLNEVKSGGRIGDAADSLGEMERELDRLKAHGVSTTEKVVEKTRLGVNIAIADQAASDANVLREVADVAGDAALKNVTAQIDGKKVEPFALIDVSPGDHVIAVTAEGYFPVEKKQRAVQGATSLVEIELKPRPANVAVKTESDATIVVDGRRGTTSLDLAAGKHVLSITHRGRLPFDKEITVARGQQLVVDAPLAKTGKRRAVPWVIGGATVLAAGALTTATLALIHDGRAKDLETQLAKGNQPLSVGDDYESEVRARDNNKTTALVLGGAALAAGTVGALLYYLDVPSSSAFSHERISITPTSGGGGITVRGRF
jgi:hypothetical protein